MFVLTADQRDSRTGADLVPSALALVDGVGGRRLARAERTVGDEIQTATTDAATALDVALALTRTGEWSVGIGTGIIETPLPDDIRAARGPAFIRARDAVERAKKTPLRFALTGEDAGDAEALVRLLLDLRDRRTPPGWEVHDLLARGLTQREAAAHLGVTESAVSLRARAAGIRTEQAAIPALVRALEAADR